MIALGVIARGISVGRGSPRRGSRQKRDRWGVVALGVVAGKETEINRAHKNPQHKIPLYKSNTKAKPPKFSVPSFRRILVCNLTMVRGRLTAEQSYVLETTTRAAAVDHSATHVLTDAGTAAWKECQRCVTYYILIHGPNYQNKVPGIRVRGSTPPKDTWYIISMTYTYLVQYLVCSCQLELPGTCWNLVQQNDHSATTCE